MNKVLGLVIIGIMFSMVFASGYYVLHTKAASGFQVILPYNGEVIPLISSQYLTFNVSVYYPAGVGYTVNLQVTGPYNIQMQSAGIPIGSIQTSGYLNTTVQLPTTMFQANGTSITSFPPGVYNVTISAGVNHQTVQVYFIPPNEVQFVVYVFSNTNLPIPNANVSIYNTTSGKFLATALTNSQGIATIIAPYVVSMSNTYTIIASAPGYAQASVTKTVPPNQLTPVTVKLTLYPVTFTIVPVYFQDEGIQEPVTPAQINGQLIYAASGFEGTTLSIIINATASGMPVSSAQITGSYVINGVTKTSQATYIGKGLYNLSISLPTATNNVPYVLKVEVSGIYQSSTSSFVVLVYAQPNYIALIQQLQAEINMLTENITALKAQVTLLSSELAGNVSLLTSQISSLNATITSLKSQLKSLNSTITSLESQISSLNSTVNSLSSQLNSLKSQVSSLSSQLSQLSSTVSSLSSSVNSNSAQINSLNSKVNSMTTLEYAALGIAIVGLIVAIVALVLVFRKVA